MTGTKTKQIKSSDLEISILAAACKQSFERGDKPGLMLAHRALAQVIKDRHRESEQTLSKGSSVEPSGNPSLQSNAGKRQPTAPDAPDRVIDHCYGILELARATSFENAHQFFLKTVKKLIKEQGENRGNGLKDFRSCLSTLCLAHDLLRDRLGGAGRTASPEASPSPSSEPPEPAPPKSALPQTRIGELLALAHILDPTEHQAAVDMHKAMPEMYFGEFMVAQGFLTKPELEATLTAQALIRKGVITISQFQEAMQMSRSENRSFSDCLLNRGWINEHDLVDQAEKQGNDSESLDSESRYRPDSNAGER